MQLSNPLDLIKDIVKGFRAEKKFASIHLHGLTEKAKRSHKLNQDQAAARAKESMRAVINTIRKTGSWETNLLDDMLEDQMIVQKLRKNAGNARQFASLAHYLHKSSMAKIRDEQLREEVVDETMAICLKNIKSDNFQLVSSLKTYMTSVLNNVMGDKFRELSYNGATRGSKPVPLAQQKESFSKEYLDLYFTANNLVFENLTQIDDTCFALIVTYYQIDSLPTTQGNAETLATTKLSRQDLETIFDIRSREEDDKVTLTEVASLLDLNPKQIRKKHLQCIQKLTSDVARQLKMKSGETIYNQVLYDIKVRKTLIKAKNVRGKIEKLSRRPLQK